MSVWTTPTTRSLGFLVTPAVWNADIVNNLIYLKTAPVFDTAVIIGAATTAGVRLEVDAGALAVREGDDSTYAPIIASIVNVPSLGSVNFASDVTITHSTNTLTFAGAASGYIFNDGNVGIGVTPTSLLHLRSSAPTLTLDDSGNTVATISYRPLAASYEERGRLSWDVVNAEMRLSAGAVGGSFFQTFFTNGQERMRIGPSGNVGIGFEAGSVRLDISGLANAVRVGSVLTNDTTKEGKYLNRHYANSEEDLLVAYSYCTSTENGVAIGGGSSAQNAATLISFYTAANTITVAGTERMRVTGNGEVWIGYTADQGAYLLQVNSQIFATNATIATSDGRFKTNVQPVREGLAAVKALQPVQFQWKKHPVHNFIDGTDVGFIAQDVRAALTGRDYTGAVVTQNGSGDSEFLGMADSKLIPLLVAAVQELDAKISALRAQ